MKYPSHVSKLFGLMVAVMLVSIAGSLIAAPAEKANPPIVAKCQADLAKRLNMRVEDVKVIEAEPTVWPNAALGMPEIGKAYAEMETPGFRIILEARSRYLYTASKKSFRYGGPVDAWYCSILYLQPKPNDANLNGDLYQCSMLGTNSTLVASEVSDYYPQQKGAVLFTRRTSRSGFDLLYVKVGGKSKPAALHSALAFGAAAVNEAGTEWAAIVRPRLGSGWEIVIGSIGKKDAEKQTLSLPDGVTPGPIAWSGDNVMILAKGGDVSSAYEISPKAEKPEWKKVAYHLFPGVPDLMLNKSESLMVEQVDADGKPVVEIGTVWFTGDRHVNARIENFTMRGFDFLIGRYVFVWGEKGTKPAAYTVDFVTGEVIPVSPGIGKNFKSFQWPPQNLPFSLPKQD